MQGEHASDPENHLIATDVPGCVPPRWFDRLNDAGVDHRVLFVDQLVFDERTMLKCRYSCPAWGCRWTCCPESWGPKELIPLLRRYCRVVVLSGTDGLQLCREALALERAAFAGGCRWALAVSVTPCSTCGPCTYPEGECRHKADFRPESAMAGIDSLATMDALGIPRQVGGSWTRVSYVFLD